MSLRADFHDTSLGFLFLSTSTASKYPANKYIQAAKTSGTPPGGVENDLAV